MTVSSRRVPRDLLPAHHFNTTCPGCVRLPLSGVDSKPADDDGLVRWCTNARRIALAQEMERHELEQASAIAHAEILSSYPRPTGSKGRYRVKHEPEANISRRRGPRKAMTKPRVDLSPLFANPQFRVSTK
jgi:hypothetical protein